MESVGNILRDAREEQDLSLKEIAVKTNMGMKYLQSIEDDKFHVFPSETHVSGFIRNYATFLGLEPEPLIDLYKRTLLQEAPAPLEELTAPTKQEFNYSFLIIFALAIAGVLIAFLLLNSSNDSESSMGNNREPSEVSKNESGQDPLNQEKQITRVFKPGESYQFRFKDSEKRVFFRSITNNSLKLTLMNTVYSLKEDETKKWDFDGDGLSDLSIRVDKLSPDSSLLSISRIQDTMTDDNTTTDNETEAQAAGDRQESNIERATTVAGNTIVRSQEPVEINLTIKAKGFSTLTVVKDTQERSQHTLKEGDRINFLAENTILIKATNPYNLLLNLNNRNLEVVTRDPIAGFVFEWKRNTADGKYHLKYERVQ